eukprot:GHVU01177563.1.p3 GENE.GHVU01177563.1~~GHVU01177563.1.p3  ORF type:complete len:112 (-),score=8.06 GHVU01177563.1:146-481(-)
MRGGPPTSNTDDLQEHMNDEHNILYNTDADRQTTATKCICPRECVRVCVCVCTRRHVYVILCERWYVCALVGERAREREKQPMNIERETAGGVSETRRATRKRGGREGLNG